MAQTAKKHSEKRLTDQTQMIQMSETQAQMTENQSVTESLHDSDSENYSYNMYNVTSPIANFEGFILEDVDDALSNGMHGIFERRPEVGQRESRHSGDR